MEPPPIAATLGLVIGSIVAVIFIVKHRKAARARSRAVRSSVKAQNYTSSQQLGIFGIVVFLLPVFLIVSSNLAKGVFVLGGFVLALLPPVTLVQLPAMTALAAGGSFMTIYMPYYLCVLIWPRKPGEPAPDNHDGA